MIVFLFEIIKIFFNAKARNQLLIFFRQHAGLKDFSSLFFMVEGGAVEDIKDYAASQREVICETAICLQGPVLTTNNFTKRVLVRYHQLYPKVKLIVGLWDDTDTLPLRELRFVEVVRVKRTDRWRISGNLDLQVSLNKAMHERAMQLGCKFIFKTRCDQLMLDPDFLVGFFYWFRQFSNDRRKIVFPLHGSVFNTRLKICDQFMFGEASAINSYWSLGYDDVLEVVRELESIGIAEPAPEQILFAKYAKDKISIMDTNINSLNKKISKIIIFSDDGSETLWWEKYSYRFRPHWSNWNSLWRQWRWVEWRLLDES